jgi:hypothetical protein
MAISTATELQAAIGQWLHREDDSDFTDVLPNLIALFEARVNRELRVRAMEASLASTALASGAATLPATFLAFKELRFVGTPSYALTPKPLQWIRDQQDSAERPLYFAISGTEVVCWPQSGSVKGTYYRSIPPLADNSTNWLLQSHPDAYLFGCLEEAALWMDDTAHGQLWGARAAALLEQVQSADNGNQLNGGPLTARAR